MEKVTEILAGKQHHFQKISPGCTISDALCRMSSQHTDYLIVMDENDHFLGLLTEHDIARNSIFSRQPLGQVLVREIMNNRMPFADAEETVDQCMQLMRRHHVRHLPVFRNLQFLGILSTDDILQEAVRRRTGIFDEEEQKIVEAGY